MRRQVKKQDGSVYVTLALEDKQLKIENVGNRNIAIHLDEKVIDQMIPILQEFSFWKKIEKGKDV